MNPDEDVFDEDLVRELGLDPEDLNGPNLKKKRRAPVPPPPSVQKPMESKEASVAPPPTLRPSEDKVNAAPKVPPKRPEPQTSVPLTPETNQAMEEQALRVSKNIPIQLAAVLAKKSCKLHSILELKAGEVVEFNKQPQDLVDLVANGKLIAKAELVVIDGKMGARIVKLIK